MLLLAALAALPAPGGAQLLPGGVTGLPGQVLGGVGALGRGIDGPVGGAGRALGSGGGLGSFDAASLLDLRRARLRDLVRNHPDLLDSDRSGAPVRRAEVVAVAPAPDLLKKAEAAGFTRLRAERLDALDIPLLVLSPPSGMSLHRALERLRQIDPQGTFDYNHVFEPASAAPQGASGGAAATRGRAAGASIGLIDGGVANHPALAAARIEQRGFTSAGVKPSGHGTAVASLLVGDSGRFLGAAPGAALLVADIYGGSPAGGSAEAIARAMAWLAARQVRIVNISLVGPPNRLLERVVAALQARGVLIVAAVGNDGPSAPPQYPASYAGVVAVTGVDGRDRALIEAGRASHVDFAAPGADMAAAIPGGGYQAVRGTSFAAPLVAARLALAYRGDADAARRIVGGEAVKGKGRNLGAGIVCRSCRVLPENIGIPK